MIKFGPSGNDEAFYAAGYKHSEQSALYVKNLGLDCFEYSFGRGISMSEGKAISIGQAFQAAQVEISVHAPYFINFANPDDEMVQKSYGYVLDSAKALQLLGGNRLVFHPASQGKMQREQAVNLTEDRLKILRDYIYLNNLEHLKFCPETMGKLGQIGTVQSVEFGESREVIDVEYSGPEVQIGFNPEFLLSPLRNLTKDEIFFEFKDEMSPGVFKTLDNFICVVMPLRV